MPNLTNISPINGADVLTDTLLVNGINVCFANPGTSEMHFVGALDRKPQMRCILGLFEGVVTGAADGYARMSDKPAATLLHTGPGLSNGLANMHNAKRANSPMVNIIGDHATYHLAFDAPLTSDIEGLARPMSHWVGRVKSIQEVSAVAARAIAAANTAPGQIASLILPADMAWLPAASGFSAQDIVQLPKPAALSPISENIHQAARVLAQHSKPAGNITILLTGSALREKALFVAHKIADATGARIMAQQSNGRAQRGAGRVPIDRVPYSVDLAVQTFAHTEFLILVGAKAPVGFFAYPGKPSSMLPENCEVLELANGEQDLLAALEMLADELNITVPSAIVSPNIPKAQMPSGIENQGLLNPSTISQIVAALIPENAIVCEEAVSSGRDLFPATWGSAPHDWLQITGGAIGLGLPLALGAAIACPNRKVIDLQADGSGMYTLQALWTMARERTDVLVLIYANRRYNILLGELKAVGAASIGYNASRMLDLVDPSLNWVQLAQGMGVEAARATTAKELIDLMRSALAKPGPFLIEMVMQ
jgi:acetolactate synthase I/II/III large subunit